MASIAVYSVKGGVGKTTLAVNLAWVAATVSRRRTLLWDLDAANGSGFLLGVDPRRKHSADSIFADGSDPAKLIRPTGIAGLDLLPADESIRTLDRQLDRIGKKKRLARLTEALGKSYDRIIFDCPPVLNELSAQIIRAADLVIVPLPPSPCRPAPSRWWSRKCAAAASAIPRSCRCSRCWTCGGACTRWRARRTPIGPPSRSPARSSNARSNGGP